MKLGSLVKKTIYMSVLLDGSQNRKKDTVTPNTKFRPKNNFNYTLKVLTSGENTLIIINK